MTHTQTQKKLFWIDYGRGLSRNGTQVKTARNCQQDVSVVSVLLELHFLLTSVHLSLFRNPDISKFRGNEYTALYLLCSIFFEALP